MNWNEFVLVGGTALSLQIGHRRSIDIDFFTAGVFQPKHYQIFLRENGFHFHQQNRFKGGLLGHIDNIKVDFIRHAYPWVKPPQVIEGIRLASLEDIAAMKLNAITETVPA
ncbi:MAG: nucleotidyl transferase AbiEii/AbiGii toxin family protein [Saprospiraceae bacterium]|nr:nucleotidyl transferase AbiEii/AbiGii toxin family protein [Saprospiraceae bacterium]